MKHYCLMNNPWRQFQIYALDASGQLVWAAPHNAPRASLKIARKIQRHHAHWRYEYDHRRENIRRDYPAKHDKRVARILFVPIEGPKPAVQFDIAA